MKIRVYLQKISLSQNFVLSEDRSHYLFKVMRQKPGDIITLFNKNDGEFTAKITKINHKQCVVLIETFTKPYTKPRLEIACAFAIIKPKNVEIIIQKCTEIGVMRFIPLKTKRSQVTELNYKRLESIAMESSEQSDRMDIPEILSPCEIRDLPQTENTSFLLLNQNAQTFDIAKNMHTQNICVISGPEGGFTQDELDELQKFSTFIKISQNILRAETASILGCGIIAMHGQTL